MRESLEDFEVAPPDGLWESLAHELPGGADSRPTLRRRNFFIAAAAVALLLAVGTVVWLMPGEMMPELPVNSPVAWIAPAPVDSLPEEVNSDPVAPVRKIPMVDEPMTDKNVTDGDASATVPVIDDVIPADTSDIQVIPMVKPAAEGHDYRRNRGVDKRLRVTTPGQLSIGLLTAYAGGSSSRSEDIFFPHDDGSNAIVQPVEEVTETTYSLPFRVGVTVQYRFNSRLALESGLTYSRLSSETSVISSIRSSFTSYRLHYIGVPLTLKFRLASWRAFDMYLTAGGAVEKCIDGYSRHATVTPSSQESFRSSLSSHPLQWSLSGGAGFQIRPVGQLGIYVEPSVVWYPDDRSSIPVIYDRHPVDFSLNIGIRYILPRP